MTNIKKKNQAQNQALGTPKMTVNPQKDYIDLDFQFKLNEYKKKIKEVFETN